MPKNSDMIQNILPFRFANIAQTRQCSHTFIQKLQIYLLD